MRAVITVEKRVAITLMKLGSSGELRNIANQLGVAKCTTCLIVKEVCTAFGKSFKIVFPSGNELQAIAEDFAPKGTLRGCCGAIDGSHIPIKAPKDNAKDFYCRKSFHSICAPGSS